MQSTIVRQPPSSRQRDPVRDGLVVLCMTVVALALGIGLHLQFALAFWLAVVAALAVYVALLSTHVLIRRSEQIDALRREVVRLENVGARAGVATAPVVAADHRTPPTAPVGQTRAQPAAPAIAWPASPATAAEPNRRASDAEQIDAVIRKLAADITQGQAARARAAAATQVPRAGAPQVSPEIDESVAALQAAADEMREAAAAGFDAPATERREPQSTAPQPPPPAPMPLGAPPPLPQAKPNDPARSRLAAVADALERERFDVLLDPILGLDDRRAQHFEVSLRLRDGLGDSMSGFGIDRIVPGSGLLPLLDAAKVEAAARVAWRMEDRAKPGALFSQLSGESLVSDRFLNRFADTYRQGDALGARLVLSFRQSELLAYSDMQWSTLRDMADLGFRFCLDDITTLDQDFSALAAAGFTFCRLDADVFIEGLPTETGVVPAADICRHLASLELAVIVRGIADEEAARRLRSYGVPFGQGALFGGARPVKADVLRNPHAAVA